MPRSNTKTKRKKRKSPAKSVSGRLSSVLAALVSFLFITSFSVVFTLCFRPLYYFDIQYQQLTFTTGLTEEVIRKNYDVLIDYNLLTKNVDTLQFPNFPMSEHGRIHFAEVKEIFIAVQILMIVTALLALIFTIWKFIKRDYRYLKYTSIATLVIPMVLGVLAALNWDTFFVTFHHLFFKNNYWLFNPAEDPIINILPDAYFLHCLILILLLMLLGAFFSFLIYRLLTRKR